MTQKNKGRSGGHQATPKTTERMYFNAIASWVQTWIVTLAVWSWLLIRWVQWVFHNGGPRHD